MTRSDTYVIFVIFQVFFFTIFTVIWSSMSCDLYKIKLLNYFLVVCGAAIPRVSDTFPTSVLQVSVEPGEPISHTCVYSSSYTVERVM